MASAAGEGERFETNVSAWGEVSASNSAQQNCAGVVDGSFHESQARRRQPTIEMNLIDLRQTRSDSE